MNDTPQFGKADLTNCEREPIHLPGSIQPHGILLVVTEPQFFISQASRNVAEVLGIDALELIGQDFGVLGQAMLERVAKLAASAPLSEPVPLQGLVEVGGNSLLVDGMLHRSLDGDLIVELMPRTTSPGTMTAVLDEGTLVQLLTDSIRRFSHAPNIGALSNYAVQAVRELTGYDRVMIYRFDPDGHGQIVGEARDARLESLLGHRYPATDIPKRARELYIRNRVRVLVDVHYEAAPLIPVESSRTGRELDMSMCYLRSMSPLHLQYLKNMGVTGTLVISLVRDGSLWGLIAAHHYSARDLSFPIRAAAELIAEAVTTRIAAIENYAHARVAIQVRRLEQRLIEATSSEGDWRLALFRNPSTLLSPLEATGAALFYEGSILTTGEVPSTPELRALVNWIDKINDGRLWSCTSIANANHALSSLTPLASGVLATKLSTTRPEYLVWFRKEQLHTVTWAGDPTKPIVNNDPLELSPRRSFAAWSEIVRGTALPWSKAELAMATAISDALIDIVVQVHAVQMLIAHHQIERVRAAVDTSREPVVVLRQDGSILFCNGACKSLCGMDEAVLKTSADFAARFSDAQGASSMLRSLVEGGNPWRGELELLRADLPAIPVQVRADPVPGPNYTTLGFVVSMIDLTDAKDAARARAHLEQSLTEAVPEMSLYASAESVIAKSLTNAIVTNASLAAMDIADGIPGRSIAPGFQEVEQSTQRATRIQAWIRAAYGPVNN